MKILKYKKFLESKESEIAQICKRFEIENWSVNKEGLIYVEGNVSLVNKGLKEIPLKFGKVEGYFNFSYNKLISLEGSPKVVGGNFYCQSNKLTSLRGGPKIVSFSSLSLRFFSFSKSISIETNSSSSVSLLDNQTIRKLNNLVS